jgi:aminopeptidase N
MRWPLPLLLAVLALRCAHAPAPASTQQAAPEWPQPQPPELRLPGTVVPVRYALDLKLIPAEPRFSGTVVIDVDVREPVRQVWLHGQDLEVTEARVEAGERTLQARAVTESEGRLGLLLPDVLPPGPARLHLSFSGSVDRELSRGLYGQDEGGESYLYTVFEPVDARRAFPCFDEPAFKVPWRLRLTVKAGHVALANHAIVSREPLPDGLERVTFAESRPMPSYLVAFMVGPFDIVDAGTVGRGAAPLRFIVPKGRGPETAYAARVTPRIVSLLEDFFDQPYPYEKLDVAVVPRYWGTMEHPGLVALGQPLTLIRPDEETYARRKWYVHIANHELGHYWFGNIVTCAWWDDIWLNEALTSWLDRKTVEPFDPSWGFAREAGMNAMSLALDTDALAAALPVRKPARTHDEIQGVFDNGTTYAKGSTLIGMFEAWLGEERMRELLRAHVRKHAWGVSTSEDFATTLSEAAGPEVARAFRSFIDQPGAPRITAELTCKPGTPARLKLTQERFLPAGSTASATQTWSVPVCVRMGTGGGSLRSCALLTEATGEMPLPMRTCPTWLLLNAGGKGYYRVSYSREQLAALLAASRALTTEERLSVLADVEAAVRRGDLPLGEALREVVPATAGDADRLVVERGARLLQWVNEEGLSDSSRQRFRAWVALLYGPRARKLGWEAGSSDDDETKALRELLLERAAVDGEDRMLVLEARGLARAWLKDPKAVDPEAVPGVLKVAARAGDRALFDTLMARARAAEDGNERGLLLHALGAFREPALVREALALVASEEFDLRDTRVILTGAFGMPETRALAWDFYREHFDALAGRMRSDELGGFIDLAGTLCGDARHVEALAFLGPRVARLENGPSAFAKAEESIRLCATADRLHREGVEAFLRLSPLAPGPARTR